MNIYLIKQTENNDWDTYDGAVVYAPDEETARHLNPRSGEKMTEADWKQSFSSWCSSPTQVVVELIGKAKGVTKPGLVLSSFNAG